MKRKLVLGPDCSHLENTKSDIQLNQYYFSLLKATDEGVSYRVWGYLENKRKIVFFRLAFPEPLSSQDYFRLTVSIWLNF